MVINVTVLRTQIAKNQLTYLGAVGATDVLDMSAPVLVPTVVPPLEGHLLKIQRLMKTYFVTTNWINTCFTKQNQDYNITQNYTCVQ